MVLSKSERTKLAIIDVATVVFSKRPGATLNDISDAAGIGRATLHRHFKNRDELIRILALEALEKVKEACQPALKESNSAKESLEKLIAVLVPLGHKYRFLGTSPVTFSDLEVSEKYYDYLADLSALADKLKDEKNIGTDIPTAWIVAVIDALIYAAWFTVDDGYIAKHDAAPLALRTILNGLGALEK